jgi:cytochrome c
MRRGASAATGLLVTGLLAALAGCATLGLRAKPPPSAAQRGHAVAKRACAACHAVEAGGVSPRARAPAFASQEMAHTASLEDRVAEITSRGHYDMPALKLRPDEVSDLVTYIASLEGR